MNKEQVFPCFLLKFVDIVTLIIRIQFLIGILLSPETKTDTSILYLLIVPWNNS